MLTARPAAPTDDKRWRAVDARMLRLGHRPDALIEVLHTVQQSFELATAMGLGERMVPSMIEAQEQLNKLAIVPR